MAAAPTQNEKRQSPADWGFGGTGVSPVVGRHGRVLFLLFRRISAVLLSLVVVAPSVVSTFGVMGISGDPITLPTQILPSFLLAVGVGATVHLLVIFFQACDRGASLHGPGRTASLQLPSDGNP